MSPMQMRILRAQYGVTQYQVAAFLQVHQSRISRAENGDTRLTPHEEALLKRFYVMKQERQLILKKPHKRRRRRRKEVSHASD